VKPLNKLSVWPASHMTTAFTSDIKYYLDLKI